MGLSGPLEIFEESTESIVKLLEEQIDQLSDHEAAVPSQNSDGAGDVADVGKDC